MAPHRIWLPAIPGLGQQARIDGDEARHAAAVKRLGPGDPVELLDGRGVIAAARVESVTPARGKRSATLTVSIVTRAAHPPASPAVHILAPAPKADRLAWMIEQISQAGVASWAPLRAERAVVDPSEHKLDRLARIAIESMKQCGRAHALDIRPAVTVAALVASAPRSLLIADAAGVPISSISAASECSVVIGPEGGLTDAETQSLRRAGGRPLRLGPHIMRIETAALAAACLLMGSAPSA